MLLHPDIVRSAPELASLEILAQVLHASLVALTAAHCCLEAEDPPCCALTPCRFAHALHNCIDELDNAILSYRAAVDYALEQEKSDQLPF